MNPDLQKAVEAGKLSKAAANALEHLVPGACVYHKNWRFGQVAGVDFLLNQITIDFSSKKGHAMQMQYAAESLELLPREHVLARIALDLPAVREQAKAQPERLVHSVLCSYGNRQTVDQITRLLVPAVFTEPEFKKWWESTKKVLKKDGHYALPTKKTDPLLYREEALSRSSEHVQSFASARQLKDQISALERILKDAEEFRDATESLQTILHTAAESARKNAKLSTAEALTLIIQCEEIMERIPGLESKPEALSVSTLIREEQRVLTALLEEVPAAKLRRVINALVPAFGEEWPAKALHLVNRGSVRVVSEAARLLLENNRLEDLHNTLERAIRDHSISSAALVWLCEKKDKKNRGGEFHSLVHPRVMSALLSAMERDQFNDNRDRKLHDLVVNDQGLIPDLIAGAELEDVREAMRKLLLTPVFEDLNKRSLLGRFVRHFPELEAMISGDRGEEKQEALIVSWESLEKRQAEYEDIVSKKIPENTKEIAIAREYGDLRENFEFKAAKEMQRVLMRRKVEMERDLALARGTDFANPDTRQVSIGTSVTLKGSTDGRIDTYHILGAWDTNPEKHIVSYKAMMAQSLLGHKLGETVIVPTESGDRSVEILSIVGWKSDSAPN